MFAMISRSVRAMAGYCLNAVLLCLLAISSNVSAAEAAPGQVDTVSRVKAAFILNIAKFAKWPEAPSLDVEEDFTLCLYQQNSLGSAIELIEGRSVGALSLRSRVVDTLSYEDQCHLLFVAAADLPAFHEALPAVGSLQSLTIVDQTASDNGGPIPEGVVLALKRRGERIGFAINLDTASLAGIRFSSELLKLAEIEVREP
ncbi:YfiR family protein [Halioglobus maricola]|uniref:YfiR family protein n=1 Tax=Halioglobus maricola TaxID=2601894 RepID=A0A5P9NFM7_9GAMM|nr:YfiR family protein [Halioglobus maricola]QFU74299.1 YfiR family protein [Halioglobus maricola]